MTNFRRMTLMERFVCWISPAARRRHDAELREALRALVADSSRPCMIEDVFVRDGYGTERWS